MQPITSMSRATRRRQRPGFSLTELLVASAIALVVMGAIAQLFSLFSRTLSQSQATVDIAGRMRSTAWQLRQDLAGVTVDLVPWAQPEANAGYFELVEGARADTAAAHRSSDLEGDTDDILMFTTRSAGGPFVGKYANDRVESPVAEVAWFLRAPDDQPVPGTKLYNLYRRQLLVVSYVGRPPFSTNGANSISGTLPNTTYDISLRADGGQLVPNTLGDLTKRENRFMHGPTFPFAILTGSSGNTWRMLPTATFQNPPPPGEPLREGEDVLLTGVIAFDVRVFDASAKALNTSAPSRYPGDPGYATGAGAAGAYVDLGWGGGTPAANATLIGGTFPPAGQTAFQSMGMCVANATRNTALPAPTYDTWSLHYEFNGENEDGDTDAQGNPLIDEGTNGVDNNGDDLPDNPPELETSPPYPVPLRGLEVRIRCYEPTSKQVRQVTLRHTFLEK